MSAAEPSKSRTVDANGSIFSMFCGVAAEENKAASRCVISWLGWKWARGSQSLGHKGWWWVSPTRRARSPRESWTSADVYGHRVVFQSHVTKNEVCSCCCCRELFLRPAVDGYLVRQGHNYASPVLREERIPPRLALTRHCGASCLRHALEMACCVFSLPILMSSCGILRRPDCIPQRWAFKQRGVSSTAQWQRIRIN